MFAAPETTRISPVETFCTKARPEEQFHVAVKRSSLAHMRRTPQENVFREIAVMVSVFFLFFGSVSPYRYTKSQIL